MDGYEKDRKTIEGSLVSIPVVRCACYEFVNDTLSFKSPSAFGKLKSLWAEVQKDLSASHQANAIIPYHYDLIIQKIVAQPSLYKGFEVPAISSLKPGDLFIHIDPNYNPDPMHRSPKCPSGGTHIAFVDAVERNEKGVLELRLLDASLVRKKGRSTSIQKPKDQDPWCDIPCVAYSWVNLYGYDDKTKTWNFQFHQMKKTKKRVSVLRILEES